MIWAGAAALAASLVYGFGAVDPQVPRWLVVHGVAAALLVRWAAVTLRRGEIVLPAAFVWSAPLVLWAGASILWSADPLEGVNQIKSGLALWAIALAATRLDVDRIAPWIVLAAACLLVMIWALPRDVHGGLGNENFPSESLLLAAPFAVALGWRGAPVLAALAVYVLFLDASNVEGAALAAVGLALAWRTRRRRLWTGGLAAAVLGVVAASETVRYAFAVRFELWWNTLAMWLDAPLAGHGLGAYNHVYPRFQQAHRWFEDVSYIQGTQFPGHAHNEVLQLGAELGLIGLALAAFAAWRVLAAGGPSTARWCLVVAGGLSLIEFPLHNASTGMIAALAAGMAAGRAPDMRVRLHWPARLPSAAAAVSLAIGIALAGVLSFRAERAFAMTYATIGERPLVAFQTNLRAYETYPLSRRYRHQLGLTFAALMSRSEGRVEVTTEAADRIHGIALSGGPSNPVLLARLEFLVNTGRAESREARQIVEFLSQRGSLHEGVKRAMKFYSEK